MRDIQQPRPGAADEKAAAWAGTEISTVKARQGVTLGTMRYVLLFSTVFAVLALILCYWIIMRSGV
jgi:hypothetical protein